MSGVSWDSEGVIHVDFLPHDVTINAQYCSNLLRNDVHQAITKKRPGLLSKKIMLLYDNPRPHTANLTKTTVITEDWEIMKHLLTALTYSPVILVCLDR
jgi:hypothetical protein